MSFICNLRSISLRQIRTTLIRVFIWISIYFYIQTTTTVIILSVVWTWTFLFSAVIKTLAIPITFVYSVNNCIYNFLVSIQHPPIFAIIFYFFYCHIRCLFIVREAGLEPARHFWHHPLKVACLPIPPFAHNNWRNSPYTVRIRTSHSKSDRTLATDSTC